MPLVVCCGRIAGTAPSIRAGSRRSPQLRGEGAGRYLAPPRQLRSSSPHSITLEIIKKNDGAVAGRRAVGVDTRWRTRPKDLLTGAGGLPGRRGQREHVGVVPGAAGGAL